MKRKTVVPDSTFFFLEIPIEGDLIVPPAVADELKDLNSKMRFEKYLQCGLKISEPQQESREEVKRAAKKSGDLSVLSATDIDVAALAWEREASVATDDFALSNTAQHMGVGVIPLQQRRAKKRKWKYRCSGCGRYYDEPGTCEVCGLEIKRKVK
ncbi:MAG: nucleotide-binding protein [Methanomicrobiaceae archaeon]|nr:nucleotide-binding protein [Methanomicrobiaceae archaeon]